MELSVLGSSIKIVSFCVCLGVLSTAHLCSSVCVFLSTLQEDFLLAFTAHLKKGTVAGWRAHQCPMLLHGELGAWSTTIFLQLKVWKSK